MSNVNTLPVASYFLSVAPTILTIGHTLPPDGFDIYCFFDSPASMGGILTDPSVTVDNPSAFSVDPANSDLIVASGGAAPNTDESFLSVDCAVPATWTMQVVLRADSLPVDFSNLVNEHLYFGTVDHAGPAAGLFLSSVGLAYAPLVDLPANDLVLVGPFQPIPGTSDLFENGVSYTFRIATDMSTRSTYIFATPTDDVPFIGHRLVAVLPAVLTAETAPFVADGTTLSVRGTETRGVVVAFDQVCLGTGLIMPNLPPRADAGRDQALRACTVGVLDGSASFDPEGSDLLYYWRLLDTPGTSAYAVEGADGFTLPMPSPSGFSDKLYSAELGSAAAIDHVLSGDVLTVQGSSYTVVATGVNGTGYYVQFATAVVPDNLVNATFKLLRKRAISHADTSHPSFFPDAPGIYRFDLTVSDGQYTSVPSVTIVNVLDSQVPRGCVPDFSFLWSYISDFWNLVEDRERIQVLWEGLAQVTASELLNLWQVDYSKSLRDIQRQFQRKWLHYDLKLPEPLPELTVFRNVRGGVRSSAIAAGGVSGVQGTQVVLTSPMHDPLTIVFQLPNPYYAAELQTLLMAKLLEASPEYTVTLLANSAGANAVRVNAPFPFSIGDGSTLPIFTVGSTNASPSGTSGVRLGARVFNTGVSLAGMDIQPNDVLVVGSDGYLVSRVVDDPTDAERYQRVVVQSDMPIVTSSTWRVPGHVTSKLLDFYNGQVSAQDDLWLEVVNKVKNERALGRVIGAGATADMPTRFAVDLTAVDAYLAAPDQFDVFLAYVIRRTRIPVGELVMGLPQLQENIAEKDDGAVLRCNVDFTLELSRGANSVRFQAGNVGDAGDVWQGVSPPDRLWAETTYLDNSPTIEGNFGIPADLTVEQLAEIGTDTDYLSAVRGLWYTLINGPTMFNLRAGTQILLGLPFAEEAGTITEIRTDFSPTQGRILMQDASDAAAVRSYSFPASLTLETNPATGKVYAEGDTVKQFAPLVSGAEVLDYVKDPKWFQGILQQGAFFEVEKFHRFLVRVDSAAFNLSALLFVQNFILRVKPTYVMPSFVVRVALGGNGDTEVDVTDTVAMKGRLILNAGACFPAHNSATMFDQYRPAGGGVRNKFDTAEDPSLSPPTLPTPTLPITWGFDKKYLCPEDEIAISYCVAHAGGVVQFDEGLRFDAFNSPSYHFNDTGITSVAAGPTGHSLPGTATISTTGHIISARVVIVGTLGTGAGDYEIVIHDGASDLGSFPITVGASGLLGTYTISLAVTSGDTISARIRPATGGARAPVWVEISLTLGQEAATVAFDSGLAAGTYCFTDVV